MAKIKKKVAAPPPKVTDQVRVRVLQDLQTEFTRLTHEVDDVKKVCSVPNIDRVCRILRNTYELIGVLTDKEV